MRAVWELKDEIFSYTGIGEKKTEYRAVGERKRRYKKRQCRNESLMLQLRKEMDALKQPVNKHFKKLKNQTK